MFGFHLIDNSSVSYSTATNARWGFYSNYCLEDSEKNLINVVSKYNDYGTSQMGGCNIITGGTFCFNGQLDLDTSGAILNGIIRLNNLGGEWGGNPQFISCKGKSKLPDIMGE